MFIVFERAKATPGLNAMETIKIWLKTYYDKLLALLVLALLLASVVFLAFHSSILKRDQERFQRDQAALSPKYPHAHPPDKAIFEEGYQRRLNPVQLQAWTNRMTTPELRVSCVHCDRPIPYMAMVCPYCQSKQPEIKELSPDRDDDGIPNEWESAYGLNPLDPGDVNLDLDNDGFLNIEEYRSGTKPNDPQSRPPLTAKLYVVDARPLPFALVFKAVSKVGSKEIYQLNLREGGKTLFRSIGEDAEGFKLISYEKGMDLNNKEKQILVLKRGEKMIRLIKGEKQPWNEYEYTMHFDMEDRRFPVRAGTEFILKDMKYRVKEIDSVSKRILIIDVLNSREVWVGERPVVKKPTEEKSTSEKP